MALGSVSSEGSKECAYYYFEQYSMIFSTYYIDIINDDNNEGSIISISEYRIYAPSITFTTFTAYTTYTLTGDIIGHKSRGRLSEFSNRQRLLR
jgi:type IV secretory pathway VirB4 component